MSDDTILFLWVALAGLSALGLLASLLVWLAYAIPHLWHSFRSWWLYGRHGAAYKRSVLALKRRYDRMQEAASRFGRLRIEFHGGTDERR